MYSLSPSFQQNSSFPPKESLCSRHQVPRVYMYIYLNSKPWRQIPQSESAEAMDAIRSSCKRNCLSSSRPHPLSGTLTRSKSQLLLHRNRSGQIRSNPGRRKEPHVRSRRSRSPPMACESDTRQRSSENDGDGDDDLVLIKDLRKKMKPSREAFASDDEDLSRVLIKDLRARRVYSPQSSSGASSDLIKNLVVPKVSGLDSDCGDRKIADLGLGSSSKVEMENSGCGKEGSNVKRESDKLGQGFSSDCPNNDGIRNEASVSPDLGLSFEARNFGQGDTESLNESSKLEDFEQCDGKNGGNCSEKTEDSKEELVLTTPPDAEICGNSEVKENEGKRVEKSRVEDTSFAGNAEENACDGIPPKDSRRNDSVLKSKSVLRPRFQGKLFKAPGSVSYRRLFPFLMDIMGGDSGTPKLGHGQKDEKGVDGQDFQLLLSSQSQEASKHELKTDSCTMRDTSQSGASEAGDAVVAPVNEISYGNGSKLTPSRCLRESPVQLHMKEVISECLSVPSVKDKCLSQPKANPTADFHCVKDVGNAFHTNDFKQHSKHSSNLDYAKATNHGCTSEKFGVLNEECVLTTPPDAVIYDNPEVNVSQLESMPQDMYHVKPMDLTRTTQENAGEGLCLKTDKRKDFVLKSKSEPRPNLHRKLFKTPGSVSYRRMLPFLKDLTKDDSGISKFCHQTLHQIDAADMYVQRSKLPLSSQSQEATIDEHKTGSGPMHGTIKCNALANNILVGPANELSHGNQPKLRSSQDLPELPMQLDAKEVVHECLSAPSVNEHIEKVKIVSQDKCLSDSKFDLCSVMLDFHCAKNVANTMQNDGFKQAQNKISRQHNSQSPPKAPNLLYINGDVSNITFEHHSSNEKGFTIDYDERKQFVSLEKRETVGRYPPIGQSLNHLDPNVLAVEENEASSHSTSRSDDAVILNHVNVSNEEPRPPSEKIILQKSDTPRHGGDKAGSVLKGIVYGPSIPSKGSYSTSVSCVGEIRNGSESKATLVLNRCTQIKLSKHVGSLNYKRLLPFLLNTMKDNSCASVTDYYPKLQKYLNQTPLLPISASDLRVTPISDSNGCVTMEHCRGNSGTQQQTGLHAYDLNNDGSSPRYQIPESQSSHDSCRVIQPQDEQVVLNGCCKLESSPDPPISAHRIDLPITPLGPIIKEVITSEEEATSALPESSIYSEVKGNSSVLISSNREKPPETHRCCQSLSQQKVLEQLRVPAIGFKKGILKRNPRGCRGLCTCLNCVSFRLHAERAFEFSRNQFLDAEEVALDLMKELSHLRNMLERSTDSDNDDPVFDGSQVKGACRKAFATEQLAKDRLSQMNDDLNIHCRIMSLQRPKVRFAENVKEKVIQPGR